MKKILRFLVILLLLLIGAAILVPVLFKDKLVQVVKDNVNASLNAQVDFGDFELSIISSFPDLEFSIDDISVTGLGAFDTLRLASIGQAAFQLDVMSVIKGDKTRIHGIQVDDLYLHALVLEDGTANYDIMKETTTETGDTTDVRSEYVILLEQYALSDAEIIYDNRSLGAYIHIQDLDHEGDGSLSDKIYDLNTKTTAAEVDVVYEGIRYLKQAEAEIDARFNIQDDFRVYNLLENEIRVNRLLLEAEGEVYMPEEGVEMDIRYRSKETDLKNILSLVPADYMPDLDGLTTEGDIILSGDVKGKYDDNNLPGFSVVASIEQGRIQYPDLPEDIQDIRTDLAIRFPGGADFDATTVDITDLHLKVADNPISGSLALRTMLSDPFIKTNIDAQADLGTFKDAITMEGVEELSGLITADIDMEGKMSAIEQERYSEFIARGSLIMQDFRYTSDSLPPIDISIAHLNVEPAYMEIPNLKMTIGQSDLKAQGRVDNYLGYALKDEVLRGRFDIQSDMLDLNELMGEEETGSTNETATTTASAEEEPMEVIRVPETLDLSLNARMDNVRYGDMEMKNLKGGVRVKEGQAQLENLRMDMLGGAITLNGTYVAPEGVRPRFDFGFDLAGLSIPNTASTFNTVQRLAPVAEQCTGDFSSSFNMSTELDEFMNPIYSTLDGGGNLLTSNVVLENFDVLQKVASALSLDNWDSQSLNNVRMAFAFEDGKVKVNPFDVKLDGMAATIGGTMSFEQDLDYDIDLAVPTAKLGSKANDILGGLLGQANNKLGTDIAMAETIDMRFKVTGKVGDTQVKPIIMGSEGAVDIKETIVNTVKQEVEEKKEELIEDTKAEAREQADKMIAEAEKQADRIRKEAGKLAEETRKQGEAAAKKIEDEAKNPFAKAAAKLAADKVRKESNEKAQKIEDEADQRAQSLVDKARSEADALLE